MLMAEASRTAPERRLARRHARCSCEAAPGIERSEAPTVADGEPLALCRARQDLSQARARHVPHHQVDRHGGDARHLLRSCRGCAGTAVLICPTRPC